MEEQTYSDIDILNDAVSGLGKLRIPVDLSEDIGSEISRIWKNLKALLNARVEQDMRANGWHPAGEKTENAEPEVISEETVGGESEENT